MSASRLDEVFARARKERRAVLVGYLCAGDPDPESSLALLDALASEADIVEIGVPFSDPMADGPVIQRASERALRAGTRLADVFALTEAVRKKHPHCGIVLMGYANPAYAIGWARYMQQAAEAGADGVLLVDLPPEEAEAPHAAAQEAGLAWIPLLAPTSDDARIEKAAAIASGFVYYVSIKGVTGAKLDSTRAVRKKVEQIRRHCALPVCVGFGVKTARQAKALAGSADGVVVGSRFVVEVEKHGAQAADAIRELARKLRGALGREE